MFQLQLLAHWQCRLTITRRTYSRLASKCVGLVPFDFCRTFICMHPAIGQVPGCNCEELAGCMAWLVSACNGLVVSCVDAGSSNAERHIRPPLKSMLLELAKTNPAPGIAPRNGIIITTATHVGQQSLARGRVTNTMNTGMEINSIQACGQSG